MSRQRKPRVSLRCVANHYAGPRERIIEVSWPDGSGGLISLSSLANGTPVLAIYRLTRGVLVTVSKEDA